MSRIRCLDAGTALRDAEDKALIESVLAGEREAFSELVRRHETKVRGYCEHMLGSHVAAQDAAQEIFLKAFRSISSFRKDSLFSTWLYRISANHCIDIFRKNRLKAFFSLDNDLHSKNAPLLASISIPAERAIPAESKQMLKIVLSALPADYRSLILFRELYGLSYDELAQMQGCTRESIKSRLKRARRKLVDIRRNLESPVPHEGD